MARAGTIQTLLSHVEAPGGDVLTVLRRRLLLLVGTSLALVLGCGGKRALRVHLCWCETRSVFDAWREPGDARCVDISQTSRMQPSARPRAGRPPGGGAFEVGSEAACARTWMHRVTGDLRVVLSDNRVSSTRIYGECGHVSMRGRGDPLTVGNAGAMGSRRRQGAL